MSPFLKHGKMPTVQVVSAEERLDPSDASTEIIKAVKISEFQFTYIHTYIGFK